MSDAEYAGLVASREFAPSMLENQPTESDLEYCHQQVRRAGLFLEKGRIDRAEGALRQGLERVPEHPECVAYLAICLAAGQRKYMTAEKLIKNILHKNPYDSTAWYARGRVNLLGGRRKQAFADFAKARQVSRDDVTVEIITEKMDPRREPVLAFLPRDNFLNIILGRLRARMSR